MVYVGLAGIVLGALLALSGLWKMVTRRGTTYRWQYAGGDMIVREAYRQSALAAFVVGVLRLVIGGLIAFGSLLLAQSAT